MHQDLNKAVYTAISVACGWAGAVLSLCKPRNSEIRDRKLDDTDRPTDRRTDIVSYRVACTRLITTNKTENLQKNEKNWQKQKQKTFTIYFIGKSRITGKSMKDVQKLVLR